MSRIRHVAELEIAIGDRVHRLTSAGLRLAPPPSGDVAVEEGIVSLRLGPGGAVVQNLGELNVFAAGVVLPPRHSSPLKPGQTFYVGNTAVRLRTVARPPARWRRLVLPFGLMIASFAGIIALSDTGPKPFDLETEIGIEYPAALPALSEAREAIARDDRDRAGRAFGGVRDVVLVTIHRRGYREGDGRVLEAISRRIRHD